MQRLIVPVLLLLASSPAAAQRPWMNKALSWIACGMPDFRSDVNNCGGCGIKCPSAHTCCGGQCMAAMDNALNCGACGVACGTNEMCCAVPVFAGEPAAFACYDIQTSAEHCGSCSTPPCPYLRVNNELVRCCGDGRGQCIKNTNQYKRNRQNCGACGVACPGNCSDGVCCGACEEYIAGSCRRCDTDEAKRLSGHNFACCDGIQCTDLNSDTNNCGVCGNTAVPDGQKGNCAANPDYTTSIKTCVQGVCRCPWFAPHDCVWQSGGSARWRCVDLTIPNGPFCGICGRNCEADSCCIQPASGGLPHCRTTYFRDDPRNCGACGRPVPNGWSCCNGNPTNTLSDNNNCGTCGTPCEGSCRNGNCEREPF
jgi:hypothetical protein